MADRLIRPGDERLTDATQVGHKFARQERMRRAGFRVPAFFCVPAAEFDSARDGAVAASPDSRAEAEILAWAREAVSGLAVPRELGDQLRDAVEDLVGAGGLVAVRACVVVDERGVGEDSAGDPFAGLTDSFLYVRPPDVPSRVVRCWASGLSPAAIGYRLRRGLPPCSVRVAVGIQRMVLGTRSFVAFSRDPRTGRRSSVVAAAHGIGEGVVAERADIDHFFVDRDTGAIRAETVRKDRMVTGSDASGEVVVRPVPAGASLAPVLADEEVQQVAELAVTVEEFFGTAQDVEGTITPDGVIHLVQARPVVPAGPSGTSVGGHRIPWSNNNITESFSGVSSAATFSQARIFYRLIFHDGYRRMGVSAARLRTQEHQLNRMIGQLDGRVYYRLDAWCALHGQIPGFAFIRSMWARAMGLTERTSPTRAELVRALPTLPALAVRLARHPLSVRRFLRWWDDLFDGCPTLDRLSPEELIACYRRLWAEVGQRWGVTLVNGFFLYACASATAVLVRRWVTEDDQRVISGLLLGGRANRSVLAARSAVALAELVSRDPELRDRLRREPAGEIWSGVAEGRYGRELATAAATHLHRYGDRAMHDLKLEELSPRQCPRMILEMIRPIVHNGVAGTGERDGAVRAAAERELRDRCPRLVRRLVIRTLAAMLRWLVRVREDTRYCRSQLFGLSRQLVWNLGRHLVEAGAIEHRRDVFDLTVEEVLGAYDGTLVDPDLRALVRARRRVRHAAAVRPDLDAELSTPAGVPVADGLPARVARHRDGPARTELRGLASSHGVARYPARVVLDSTVAPESCRDRIIVAKETDPGWLFLLMAARGLVVERGTLLSHTAVTGRLLGVPTVVSVPGATALIRDGALIEIDGAAGTVRLL